MSKSKPDRLARMAEEILRNEVHQAEDNFFRYLGSLIFATGIIGIQPWKGRTRST